MRLVVVVGVGKKLSIDYRNRHISIITVAAQGSIDTCDRVVQQSTVYIEQNKKNTYFRLTAPLTGLSEVHARTPCHTLLLPPLVEPSHPVTNYRFHDPASFSGEINKYVRVSGGFRTPYFFHRKYTVEGVPPRGVAPGKGCVRAP